jgi:hypothetical protein
VCVCARAILTDKYSESISLQSLATCVSWVTFNVTKMANRYRVILYKVYMVFFRTWGAGEGTNAYVGKYVWGKHFNLWIFLYERLCLGGKYAVLSSGDLYIYNAGPSDGYKTYACRTVHRLTGEVHSSAYPGRIIITGKKSGIGFFLKHFQKHFVSINRRITND